MIQYTTPTIKIVAHGADLTAYTVRATFKQSNVKISIDATDTSYVSLDQAFTAGTNYVRGS